MHYHTHIDADFLVSILVSY